MSEEEFIYHAKRVYFTAFRHGFFSCMCGVLIYYVTMV